MSMVECRWAGGDLEVVTCDLCGSAQTSEVFVRADGMHVVECERCGLCYLNPRPKAELLGGVYEGGYFSGRGVSPSVGYADYFACSNTATLGKIGACRLAVVRRHAGSLRGKRILEIGSATGEFCYQASRLGAVPAGYDVSAQAVAEARRRYPRLDFTVGGVESLPEGEQFSAAMAFEVVEHVASPMHFIMSIRKHLEPGGWLFLSTPNRTCAKLLGAHAWAGFAHSFEHLYFFTPETLRKYGDRLNMESTEWYGAQPVVGVGVVRPRPTGLRSILRPALASLGLLGTARRARELILGSRWRYEPRQTRHNLLVAMRACALRSPDAGPNEGPNDLFT